MKSADYIFRIDPDKPLTKPASAQDARLSLEEGNQKFARWMDACRSGTSESSEFIVSCNLPEAEKSYRQAPFAVVIGCSDARVPTEMLFGQGFNDLFVIRVAGNVLGDECLGSVDFALRALSESVKIVVTLGHSNCGAVAGAVDAYLNSIPYRSRSTSMMLRAILQQIFVSVREAATGLETVYGTKIRHHPSFRQLLIDSTVMLNAAQSAFNLELEVERAGKSDIEVLYGVFDIYSNRVTAPARNANGFDVTSGAAQLANAPTDPADFPPLALSIAESFRSRVETKFA